MPTAIYRQWGVLRDSAQGEELAIPGWPHSQAGATQWLLSVPAQLSETYTHSKIVYCDKNSKENIKDRNSNALDVSTGSNSTEENHILLKCILDWKTKAVTINTCTIILLLVKIDGSISNLIGRDKDKYFTWKQLKR